MARRNKADNTTYQRAYMAKYRALQKVKAKAAGLPPLPRGGSRPRTGATGRSGTHCIAFRETIDFMQGHVARWQHQLDDMEWRVHVARLRASEMLSQPGRVRDEMDVFYRR